MGNIRDLSIAYGDSCKAKVWTNDKIAYNDLFSILKTTSRTPETADEYKHMEKSKRDSAKDKGGFVGGVLRDGKRKKGNVESRSMLTLDADNAATGFIEEYTSKCNYASILYTTHSHTPEAPRVRIIVPLTRDIAPDEYQAVSRYYADEWGIDQFDQCGFYPHQLMYWPTTPDDGEYRCEETDGDWLNPDDILSAHPDWKDCSTLPKSSRESSVKMSSGGKVEDPLTKSGPVGAFCRTYPIREAIEKFLSDVYEPGNAPGRYSYIPADSSDGVEIYDEKFAYSHHASDPASDALLNAFDLVRIHQFGDDKDSYGKMCDFVVSLDDVKEEMEEERIASAVDDFSDDEDPPDSGNNTSYANNKKWKKKLKHNKAGVLENNVYNLKLILENDPDYAGFGYNEMSGRIEITGEVPWDRPSGAVAWRDADTAQLQASLDLKYTAFSNRNFEIAFTTVVDNRRFNRIRDYLDHLPSWDGEKRVETLLIDYLNADDTDYVRAVTRKTFVAAVARIYCPGIKFDYMLVLDGPQGIGKSSIFREIVGDEFYSDTLSLTDMNDKSASEKLQGNWIVEIAELAGMKKADIEKVKAFLSTSDDKYRVAYGHTVESHPRRCIIIATVNGEKGYLRDITGNRRFWVVKLNTDKQKPDWNLDRDQIWAEAKYLWENGEKLYLEGDVIEEAEEAQKGALEVDERKGVVEEYLNMLLPDGWEDMDLIERRNYISNKDDPTMPKGVRQREEVSNLEIWCECFRGDSANFKTTDSYTISALMLQIPGWERTKQTKRQPIYGKQRIYKRIDT